MSLEIAEMLHLLEKFGCTPLSAEEMRKLETFMMRKTRDEVSDRLARQFWSQHLGERGKS